MQLETNEGEILQETIDCARKGEIISIIGVDNNTVDHFPIVPLKHKHWTFVGGQSYTQKHWKFCLEKLPSGELNPTFIISHRIRLSEVPKFYQDFEEKKKRSFERFLSDPMDFHHRIEKSVSQS